MTVLRRFCLFWYDFIVGDDWRLAIGVVLTTVAVYLCVHLGLNAWWMVPLGVAALLWSSVHVAVRRSQRP